MFCNGARTTETAPCVMRWHNVDVKRLVEYQHVRIKCSVTAEQDINMTDQLRRRLVLPWPDFDRSSSWILAYT